MGKGAFLLIVSLLSLILFISAASPDDSPFGYNDPTLPSVKRIDSFLKDTGDSASGTYDFNGGWMNEGLSIIGGDIYAQTGWFYNISALTITELKVNGSMTPLVGYDNIFDLGNSSYRWRDLYLGGQVYSNGTGDNWFLGNVGIGTASPELPLHVDGATGVASGTGSQGILQVADRDVTSGVLNMGVDTTGIFHSWIQSRSAVNTDTFNLVLNPVGGNVGIGTTTPAHKLNVVGDVNISGNVGNVVFDGTGARQIFTRATTNYIDANTIGGQLAFVVNGNAEVPPLAFIVNLLPGLAVPIPTFPSLSILTFSTLFGLKVMNPSVAAIVPISNEFSLPVKADVGDI